MQNFNQVAWIIWGMLIVPLLILALLRLRRKRGALPAHDFAYGTALESADEIPERMTQFFSLEALDPNQVKIQTFVGNNSAMNLGPLVTYISSQKEFEYGPLLAALKDADQIPDQKEKAIQAVKALLPYKEMLKNEQEQDSIIIFVFYGLKQPSELSWEIREKLGRFVAQYDNAAQADEFNSGKCPDNYLIGNINIYPLALDNTSWQNVVEGAFPKDAPILKIRFSGLGGIFKYLLDEMTAKTGASFVHLDGHSL